MAAPAPTTRQTPAGIMLENGFRTVVTFSLDPDIEVEEIEVTPGGADGGPPIDTATMWNTIRITKAPNSPLYDTPDMTMLVAFDPIAMTRLRAIINRNQTITVKHPDGSTEADFGFVQKVERSVQKRGERPTMTITVCFSGTDPVTPFGEEAPVLTSVTGT